MKKWVFYVHPLEYLYKLKITISYHIPYRVLIRIDVLSIPTTFLIMVTSGDTSTLKRQNHAIISKTDVIYRFT